MNWALAALELDAGADERSIKRAYARLLRSNRPDDDPAAFQRLHEAYQAALQWQRNQQEQPEIEQQRQDDSGGLADSPAYGEAVNSLVHGDEHSFDAAADADAPFISYEDHTYRSPLAAQAPAEDHRNEEEDAADAAAPSISYEDHIYRRAPAAQAPAESQGNEDGEPSQSPHPPVSDAIGPPPLPRVDPETTARRIVAAASVQTRKNFAQWLHECPDLWSLSGKEDIARQLSFILFNDPDPAISSSNFDLISETFGWNEVNGPFDLDALVRLSGRLHARWLLQAENGMALTSHLRYRGQSEMTLSEARRLQHWLTRPWHRRSALLSALDPSRVSSMRSTLRALAPQGQELPIPPLNPLQVRFWREVSEQERLNWTNVQIALLRGALLALAWLILPTAVYVIDAIGALQADRPLPAPDGLLTVAGVGALFFLLAGIGYQPWKLLLRWQLGPDSAPTRFPTMRSWLIPALAVLSIVLMHLPGLRIAGSILAWSAVLVALLRMIRRGRFHFHFSGWLLLLALPLIKVAIVVGMLIAMYSEAAAIAALLISAIDWSRHTRHYRRASGH